MKTRMMKAQCGDCAYTVRVARVWLARDGPPLCPCNSKPMECEAFEPIELAAAEAVKIGARTLEDRWVQIRQTRECSRCHHPCYHGEEMRKQTTNIAGEFWTEYLCQGCSGQSAGARASAIGRA